MEKINLDRINTMDGYEFQDLVTELLEKMNIYLRIRWVKHLSLSIIKSVFICAGC